MKKALQRVPIRDVGEMNRLFLFVRAGGRCEFDGCPRYLLEHHLTRATGNYAQVGHICAFSKGGPRHNSKLGYRDVNALENLMLLCPQCHKQVDDDPKQWTVEVLRRHKKAHEERIFKLTSVRPDRHTVALVVSGQIHGRVPSLSLPEIQEAVSPRYVGERDVQRIDLTNVKDDNSAGYWEIATKQIAEQTDRFYTTPFDSGPVRHASIFGLARIPLLVFLGRRLSDKVPNTLHQRHRDAKNQNVSWRWKDRGPVAQYEFRRLREGKDPAKVVLLVSLSDRLRPAELPAEVATTHSLYELTLKGARPSFFFLAREQSVHTFTASYLGALAELLDAHPGLAEVSVFPAVPAPIAIAMGRDMMPARHPTLVLYDLVGGQYIRTIEVKPRW